MNIRIEEMISGKESQWLEFKESFGREAMELVVKFFKQLENTGRIALQEKFRWDLIEMTIPDKLNSRHQRYRLTEKGRMLKGRQ